jgi:hypothetical protein
MNTKLSFLESLRKDAGFHVAKSCVCNLFSGAEWFGQYGGQNTCWTTGVQLLAVTYISPRHCVQTDSGCKASGA